ncbi:MAG: PrgI family protein [Clostridia bacterium]|nr:PrgI family protein [Clostridia bacterium]
MGTYYIPRNVKGETRILYIFTIKALAFTAAGALIGFLIRLILASIGLATLGTIILVIFAVIGYGIGAIKIPTVSGLKFTKKIGGEPLSEIIVRYFKFKQSKKIYTYFDTVKENVEEEKK